MFRTLSFKDSMTLSFQNTLIPGCGISGYDWTGTCLLRQFTNLPCFLLSAFSFLTVIGGPTEASEYFLLWSCINSEIVYKRPLVSPLVTVLQTQAQHWRHHTLCAHFHIFTHLLLARLVRSNIISTLVNVVIAPHPQVVVPRCLQSCLCFLLVKKHRRDLSNPEPHLHCPNLSSPITSKRIFKVFLVLLILFTNYHTIISLSILFLSRDIWARLPSIDDYYH